MNLTPTIVAEQLYEYFGTKTEEFNLVEFSHRITFHAKFLGDDGLDDLAALLFIACSEHKIKFGDMSLEQMSTVLSRVQKRIFRSGNSTHYLDSDQLESSVSQHEDFNHAELIEQIKHSLSAREFLIFHLRYVEFKTLSEIAASMGSTTTEIHRQVTSIKKVLKKTLA